MEPIAADEMVIEYVGQNIRQVRFRSSISPAADCTTARDFTPSSEAFTKPHSLLLLPLLSFETYLVK